MIAHPNRKSALAQSQGALRFLDRVDSDEFPTSFSDRFYGRQSILLGYPFAMLSIGQTGDDIQLISRAVPFIPKSKGAILQIFIGLTKYPQRNLNGVLLSRSH